MIKSFKSKKLEKAHKEDDFSGIYPEHRERCRLLLSAIEAACEVNDLDQASFKLHKLKGNRKDIWAITVRANWRITFRFEGGDAYILDYEDYH
jgi:proteic killer suppression protein